MREHKSVIFLTVVILLLLAAGAAVVWFGQTQTENQSADVDTLTVTVFNTGKSDCILLRAEKDAILIDTADSGDGKDILAALADRGVTRLSRMILTHNDKDHIGGADELIEGIPVGELLQSAYSVDSKQYRQLDEAVQAAGIRRDWVSEPVSFSLGGAQVNVWPAKQSAYENENDFSLVVEVRHGENRLLFTGDARNERITELLQDGLGQYDFLKVPHHGRACSMSEKLFLTTRPKWAVITCSEEEGAEDEVVAMLEALGAQVLLTKNGTVETVSDGATLTVRQLAG